MKAESTRKGWGHGFDRIGDGPLRSFPRSGREELEQNRCLSGCEDAGPAPDSYFGSLPVPEKDKRI